MRGAPPAPSTAYFALTRPDESARVANPDADALPLAAAAMSFSPVSVIANALLLRRADLAAPRAVSASSG
jgi:hypothetical protein